MVSFRTNLKLSRRREKKEQVQGTNLLIMTMETHRMPPGQTMDDWLTGFRSGMWRLEYGWGFSPEGHTRYFREFQPLLHQTKHDVLGNVEDEAWYLVYIGTKPEARGKGYARALIESVTKVVGQSFLLHSHSHPWDHPM